MRKPLTFLIFKTLEILLSPKVLHLILKNNDDASVSDTDWCAIIVTGGKSLFPCQRFIRDKKSLISSFSSGKRFCYREHWKPCENKFILSHHFWCKKRLIKIPMLEKDKQRKVCKYSYCRNQHLPACSSGISIIWK